MFPYKMRAFHKNSTTHPILVPTSTLTKYVTLKVILHTAKTVGESLNPLAERKRARFLAIQINTRFLCHMTQVHPEVFVPCLCALSAVSTCTSCSATQHTLLTMISISQYVDGPSNRIIIRYYDNLYSVLNVIN